MLPGFCIPMVAGADTPVAPTWNPATKSADAVLTVGNTVLNKSGAPVGQQGAIGLVSWNTGKHYFECKLVGTKSTNDGVGFCDSTFNFSSPNSLFWEIAFNGSVYAIYTGGSTSGLFTFGTPAANDIINCAWDASVGEVYLGLNGTYYDNLGNATGATPTTATVTLTPGQTLFPIGHVNNLAANYTLIPPTALPAGYTQWG